MTQPNRSAPREHLLLLSMSTDCMYLLPRSAYVSIAILSGSASSALGFDGFIELSTEEIVYLPSAALHPYRLPDDEIKAALLRLDVTGLRRNPALREFGEQPSALAYSGNIADPTWLSICVSGHCTSRCAFCYTEWIRNEAGLTSTQIRQALEAAATIPSVHTVVFSGGEPTLRGDLVELVEYAKGLGFNDIGIQTNGHRIANVQYLNSLLNAGVSRVLLSLHGSKPETHDALVGVRGSFERACHALSLLDRDDVVMTVNFVVCQENHSEAGQVVHSIHAISPRASIRFSYPIIEGQAYSNATRILLSFPDFIESVSQALAQAALLDVSVEVENVPPCITHQLHLLPKYQLSRRRSLLEVSPFYQHNVERGERSAKLHPCDDCTFSRECSGVQLPYLAHFGQASQHLYPRARLSSPVPRAELIN